MTATSFDYKPFLKDLTNQPGVYRMLNTDQDVIYVGKAKNLKKRVSSYFRANISNAKTRALVENIAQIEITVTTTETEALILENNFIKQYRPRYNVLLRDDKSYPYILLTAHQHPRLKLHRGPKRDKGDYFGPFPGAGAVSESLRLMQKIFPVRQCEDGFYRARTRPCLQYQLNRCSAPCVEGKVSDEEYQQQVKLAKMFLMGKSQDVISQLVEHMEQASLSLAFEEAAKYRDQITTLRKVQEQQYVSGASEELDVVGFFYEHGIAAVHVLFIRDHKILGSKNYFPDIPKGADPEEIVKSFLLQFYLNTHGGQKIPAEIIVSHGVEDVADVEQVISSVTERKVTIRHLSRGEKHRYQSLAERNAKIAVATRLSDKKSNHQRYQQLQEFLELDEPVRRMECFDISHTMGEQTIASCVVFNHEGPSKADYRRYNVVGVTPGDDYGAMDFALKKRYSSVKEETNIPDIIFIDGGKGQLARAETYFSDWPHSKMPLLIGVAKGVSRKAGLETLIFAGGTKEVNLAADSPALHLIQHIRDEAHRFAITGHRNKRAKEKRASTLQHIEGIGPKRRQALLKYFGGLQGIKGASVDELAKTPGISKKQAQIIFDSLNERA